MTKAGLMAASLSLAGCSVGGPYVYNLAAIDRDKPNFGKPIDPADGVRVCYSKYNSDPAEVLRLAREVCAAAGYGVRYQGTYYSICSLTSPAGAVFDCIDAEGNSVTRGSNVSTAGRQAPRAAQKSGVPGQPGAPLEGFSEGERPMGILFGRPEPAPASR